MFFVLLIVALLVLYIWSTISTSWSTQSVRKRVRQLTTTCHSENESIFVIINCAEADAAMAVANCFAAASCPQRVFVTAPVSEQSMIYMKDRVASALRASMQPSILCNNFISTIVYTRGDLVRQCAEESFRNEKIVLVSQGTGIFLPNFDNIVRTSIKSVRDPSQCLFTQFPPFHKLSAAGFPSLRRTQKGLKMYCHPFSRRGTHIVSVLACNHQLMWFSSSAAAKVNLRPSDFSYAVIGQKMFGQHVFTTPIAIRAAPQAINWWKAGVVVRGDNQDRGWQAKYGLSTRPTTSEIVVKLGSQRRYDDIKHTETLNRADQTDDEINNKLHDKLNDKLNDKIQLDDEAETAVSNKYKL